MARTPFHILSYEPTQKGKRGRERICKKRWKTFPFAFPPLFWLNSTIARTLTHTHSPRPSPKSHHPLLADRDLSFPHHRRTKKLFLRPRSDRYTFQSTDLRSSREGAGSCPFRVLHSQLSANEALLTDGRKENESLLVCLSVGPA